MAIDGMMFAVQSLLNEDSDRDYIVITGPISRRAYTLLSELLEARRSCNSKATVFLTTYGGDPDGGYRIGRCLRHYYKEELRVVVPSFCKSAGTLIAIAGHEIAIGDRGELGPLDVQVFKGSELFERSSGLDITEALAFVGEHVRWGYHSMLKEARQMGLSTKLAAEMAAHIGAAVAAPLLNQVDPLRLGELQRSTRIATDYGMRLDSYSSNLKPNALQQLISGYPSHSFVIDRKEAGELFHRVYPLTSAEELFVSTFPGLFIDPDREIVMAPDQVLNHNSDKDGRSDEISSESSGGDVQADTCAVEDQGDGLWHTSSGRESLPIRTGSEGISDITDESCHEEGRDVVAGIMRSVIDGES